MFATALECGLGIKVETVTLAAALDAAHRDAGIYHSGGRGKQHHDHIVSLQVHLTVRREVEPLSRCSG
jgi:hypothetical protein